MSALRETKKPRPHRCKEHFEPKMCPCCGGRLLIQVYRYTANYADPVRKRCGKTVRTVGYRFYKKRETERTRYCRRCQMSVEYNIGPAPSED